MISPRAILRDVKRLAVVCPSWVGDTVMATPVFRAVRQALPQAHLCAFMRRGLDEVLNGSPWFNELNVCDMKGAWGPVRLAREIRKSQPDAVLLLPNSFRSALAVRLSGAPVRIGYARDGRGWLLTHICEPSRPSKFGPTIVAMVDHYAALGCFALGVDQIDRHIELATTTEERAAADQMLADVGQTFALLNPGANRADKRWPARNFAALADQLASSRQLTIVISGSPGEKSIISEIIGAAKVPIVNLAERGVTLGSLKAVIQRAAVVVTNDTGPRHFAAALGTPVVTLFGPTDHRWTTLVDVREHLLLAEPFLPEELVADKYRKACAIDKISVTDVMEAVNRVMRRVC